MRVDVYIHLSIGPPPPPQPPKQIYTSAYYYLESNTDINISDGTFSFTTNHASNYSKHNCVINALPGTLHTEGKPKFILVGIETNSSSKTMIDSFIMQP